MENNRKEIANAITQIIQQRGMECVKNPKIFCAILDDMIPNLQKERKIIRKVLVGNEDLCSELYNMCHSKKVMKEQDFFKLRYQLKNEYGVSEEWSDFFIIVFSDAFGWKGYDKYLSKVSQGNSKKNDDEISKQSIELQKEPVKKQPKKKRKFTKIIILLILVMLLKSCLSDNGESDGGTSNISSSSTQSTQTTEKDESETIDSQEESLSGEMTVDKLMVSSISLSAIEDTSIDVSATTIEQKNGAIIEKEQCDEYSFIPERDGTYRFEFSNLDEGYYYRIGVYNVAGLRVGGGTYGNKDGLTTNLNGKEEYVITIEQNADYLGSYTLNIGKQKEIVDITDFTIVNDSIQFKSQKNNYSFTPLIDGKYHFGFSNIPEGYSYRISVHNAGGERIDSGTYGKGEGLTVKLSAGQTYIVDVEQNADYLGNYTLNVGKQKETVDITEYTVVNDSFQFKTQENNYVFTSAIGGRYHFEFSNIPEGYWYEINIYNAGGDRINGGTFGNKEGFSVELGTEQTYTIIAKQSSDYLGNYGLNIGKQKEIVDITDYILINDSIEFEMQKNNYTYIPSIDGVYYFGFSNVPEGYHYNIYVYNAGGERIDYGTYGNEEGIDIQLTSGQVYTIAVEYYDNLGNYELNIEKLEEQ